MTAFVIVVLMLFLTLLPALAGPPALPDHCTAA
jgi:hypothetical protein